MAEQEGIIKYNLEHKDEALSQSVDISKLNFWRAKLANLGLVGQDPDRYDGYGFGNLSQRYASGGFIITGSQTGELKNLTYKDYAWVQTADTVQNKIVSQGATKPSSEALTHAAVYDTCSQIRYVFHAHSPDIWRNGTDLCVPATADVPYGTPEMAIEVSRLVAQIGASSGLFTMEGHEDGIVAFGPNSQVTGSCVINAIRQIRT